MREHEFTYNKLQSVSYGNAFTVSIEVCARCGATKLVLESNYPILNKDIYLQGESTCKVV